MASHPLLTNDGKFAPVRAIFAALYPRGETNCPIDFTNPNVVITEVKSGRLSFVFTAEQEKEDGTIAKAFLKIVKPGDVQDNIPASAVAIKELHENTSVPTIPPFYGVNKQLTHELPDAIAGVDPEAMKLVKGQRVILTEGRIIDTIKEDLKKEYGDSMPALMREVGRIGAKTTRGLMPLIKDPESAFLREVTSDPFGFRVLRTLFMKTFDLSKEQTHLTKKDKNLCKEVQTHIDGMIPNLDRNDNAAEGFAVGLARGDLIEILDRFNAIERRIKKSLKADPAPNVPIHNEVKPANIGALHDPQTNSWRVTQFFDFDQIACGTAKNHDPTPAEKDLGRSISFLSFDPNTGEFLPKNAEQLIAGFLEYQPKRLTDKQIERLKGYIMLGVLTSYPVRASYLADELKGERTQIELTRLNPSIHLNQLKEFDTWLEKNDFHAMVHRLENLPSMAKHRQLIQAEDLFLRNNRAALIKAEEQLVRQNPPETAAPQLLQTLSYAMDAAHEIAEGTPGAVVHYKDASDRLKASCEGPLAEPLAKLFGKIADINSGKGEGRAR
jgi:hypothetical protein